MQLSIIIPAFNESKRIVGTLRCLLDAIAANHDLIPDWEVIVVDNNSTDDTAVLAERCGVRVVFEPVNQISRARNAGAAVATGRWLLFLDADTQVSTETLAEVHALMQQGNVVGGATLLDFGPSGLALRGIVALGNVLIRSAGLTAGCFLYCRADAFREIGGFNEELFAAEDAEMGASMKRWGRARNLRLAMVRRHPPVTSRRKLELYSPIELGWLFVRLFVSPRATARNKDGLYMFYDGRR